MAGVPGFLAGARRVYVVFHVDLDGVCSAALLSRRLRVSGLYPCPARSVYRRVRGLLAPGVGVAVVDLAPRSRGEALGLASALRGRGAAGLLWVDHHVWPEGAVEEVRRAGGVVYVDRGAPAAELVCRLVGCSGVEERVAAIGSMDDRCVADPDGLVRRWRLVLRYAGFSGMVKAVESLAGGELWPGWAEEVYREHVDEYAALLESVRVEGFEYDGVRVDVVQAPPRLSACDLELWGRLPRGADIVLILYPRAVSIRALSPSIDAACIARRLGGGGHRGAAGAPRLTSQGPAALARAVARLTAYCRKT